MNDDSKLYDSIEILRFEMAPIPDNYMDVFIKYKDFFVSFSNFHFTPKTDLKKTENWSLTDSKAVHGVDYFDLVDGTVCDCGKNLKRKYSVSQNDFCQELSKTSFKSIVLEKILQDDKFINKIISKARIGQRNNFISPYGDLSEMEKAAMYKIKNSFWEGAELEYIEKVSQKKINFHFKIADGNIPLVLEGIEVGNLENGESLLLNGQNGCIKHKKVNSQLKFCLLCLEKFKSGEDYTICSILTNQEHLTIFSEFLFFSNFRDEGSEFLKSSKVGEKMKLRKMESMIPPSIKISSLDELEQIFGTRNKNDVGRNDLCPCESGKKHKKCCLNKQ